MALVFDRRSKLSGQPGAHAFVVGISRYPNLPESASEVRPKEKFELRELTGAARSACDFHTWLKEHADRLGAPLKTIRLLVAPSRNERKQAALAEVKNAHSACDFSAVADEIYQWQLECRQSKDDLAIFYFCGNGVELSPSDPAIVLSDFGKHAGPRLQGVVSANNLVQGMAPSQAFEGVARTQLFLFDAGRRPVETFNDVVSSTTKLFDMPRARLDDRDLAVCHAASPGTKAFAPRGERHRTFLNGLIDCLDGLAAVPDSTPNGDMSWVVTIESLARALPERVRALTNGKQVVYVNTIMGGAVIVRLHKPPPIPVTITFQPTEASKGATVQFFDSTLTKVDAAIRQVAGQLEARLPVGFYQVHVTFPPVSTAKGGAVAQEVTVITPVMGPSAQIVIQKPGD